MIVMIVIVIVMMIIVIMSVVLIIANKQINNCNICNTQLVSQGLFVIDPDHGAQEICQ